ncbi:MAG: hypothetical protein LBU73_01580 [Helicobacteraceae bacterium]|jgi:uncharacterized protein (DUF1778 family)|nr:hypothetical protein [Helicobacteraceae bacterium]
MRGAKKGNQNAVKGVKRERQVHIVTSAEEYETIAAAAKLETLSISSFARKTLIAAALKAAQGEK